MGKKKKKVKSNFGAGSQRENLNYARLLFLKFLHCRTRTTYPVLYDSIPILVHIVTMLLKFVQDPPRVKFVSTGFFRKGILLCMLNRINYSFPVWNTECNVILAYHSIDPPGPGQQVVIIFTHSVRTSVHPSSVRKTKHATTLKHSFGNAT